MVGLDGVEPSTSRLSGVRSNQTELQAPGYFGSRILDFKFIIVYLFQNPNLKIQNPNEPIISVDVREPQLISQN